MHEQEIREIVHREIRSHLTPIHERLDRMAKTIQDLQAALDRETKSSADMQTRVAGLITGLQQQVADLQAQITAGQGIPDSVVDAVNKISDSLDAFEVAPAAPPANPPTT